MTRKTRPEFAAIEFLSRSDNRYLVLKTLEERRLTRSEIRTEVGISGSTVSRILDDLADREWIAQHEHRYQLTPLGELVITGFDVLLEAMSTVEHLSTYALWLPTDEFDFPLTCLNSASITETSRPSPTAPMDHAISIIDESSELRSVSHPFNKHALEVITRNVVDHDLRFEGVTSPEARDELTSDPTSAQQLDSLIESDLSNVFISHEIPHNLSIAIADETVFFLLRDENDILRAVIDTTDRQVYSWAECTFSAYRDEGELQYSVNG